MDKRRQTREYIQQDNINDSQEAVPVDDARDKQAMEEKSEANTQKAMDAVNKVKDGSDNSGTTLEAKLVTLAHVASAIGGLGATAANGGVHENSQQEVPEPRKLSEEELEQEKKARRERKKKVIIKGLTLLRTGERKKEMEQWLKATLELEVRVDKLERVGGAVWRAELESLGQKLDIMDRKGRLETLGWGVWISDDYTERQKEVQTWLERQAEGWNRKGYETSVGYQRLWVDGTCLEWDEREGELIQRKVREARMARERSPPSPPPPFRGRGRGRLQGWGAGSAALER